MMQVSKINEKIVSGLLINIRESTDSVCQTQNYIGDRVAYLILLVSKKCMCLKETCNRSIKYEHRKAQMAIIKNERSRKKNERCQNHVKCKL